MLTTLQGFLTQHRSILRLDALPNHHKLPLRGSNPELYDKYPLRNGYSFCCRHKVSINVVGMQLIN